MAFLKWLSKIAAVICLAIAVGIGIGWILTTPKPLPAGSESASRLAPGPYAVGQVDLRWVDASRPTAENGNYPGSTERVFPLTLWFPKDLDGRHPLAVFIHGLMSSRFGCTYMAEHLASYGYIVVSADFPLTNARAPGGPNYLDVVHQPADVSFLIDRALALGGSERPFEGEIDRQRIGVFGISLGGATATLVAFHPEWRDSRVTAAISIAGPGDVFGPRFFDHADVAFLMIAGTSDGIVDYETNAVPIPDRVRQGGLLTIEGATHAGFTDMTAGFLRLFGNPDRLGCSQAKPGDIPEDKSVFVGLFGSPEQGLLIPTRYRPPCATVYDDVMRAGRQHMVTTLAVRAFFESRFAVTNVERETHADFLEHTLPAELAEVTYTASRRSRPDVSMSSIRMEGT
jgi:predicted dienelactone hydrolase